MSQLFDILLRISRTLPSHSPLAFKRQEEIETCQSAGSMGGASVDDVVKLHQDKSRKTSTQHNPPQLGFKTPSPSAMSVVEMPKVTGSLQINNAAMDSMCPLTNFKEEFILPKWGRPRFLVSHRHGFSSTPHRFCHSTCTESNWVSGG